MNQQRPHVRVTTGPSVSGAIVSMLGKIVVIAFELAVWGLKTAFIIAGWLWINAVVPGVRLAAQNGARLASTIAGRAASRRGDSGGTSPIVPPAVTTAVALGDIPQACMPYVVFWIGVGFAAWRLLAIRRRARLELMAQARSHEAAQPETAHYLRIAHDAAAPRPDASDAQHYDGADAQAAIAPADVIGPWWNPPGDTVRTRPEQLEER
jgi:hypothetical protein